MQSAIVTKHISHELHKEKEKKIEEETDGGDCAGRANDAVEDIVGERIRVERVEGEASSSGGCD